MEDAKGCRLRWGRSWIGQGLEAMEDTKGCRLGWGNMTSPASMPNDGLSKPRSRKGAQTRCWHLCETLLQKQNKTKNTPGKHRWVASRQNGVFKKKSSFSFKKTASRSYSVHWWLSHQRPLRVGLHCRARCNYLPWPAAYTVSTYSLTMEVEAVGHALCWIDPRHDSPTTRAISLPLASILRRSLWLPATTFKRVPGQF